MDNGVSCSVRMDRQTVQRTREAFLSGRTRPLEFRLQQLQALLKMKRELRTRMEREIGELQKIIIQNDEDDYFQDLDVQRLRNRVHMASFQYNKSYLH